MAKGERSLRKLIAELAEMREAACHAVLAELDAAQRGKVRALLDEYAGGSECAPAALPPLDPRCVPADLSPWLTEQLGASDTAGARSGGHCALTPETRHVLRACAEELRKSAGGAEAIRPSRWKTLRHRVSAIRVGEVAR